jgi:hypothetical protein
MMMNRFEELQNKLVELRKKEEIRFTFSPSTETNFIRYFPKDIDSDLRSITNYKYVNLSEHVDPDIFIVTAHGADLTSGLNQAKQLYNKSLIAVWMWDNHISIEKNIRTSLAADLIFPSHLYNIDYLLNSVSAIVAYIPACSAQWTVQEARGIYNKYEASIVRKEKVLLNYVDYEPTWRSSLLKHLNLSAPEADVIIMPRDDRSRYFEKTSEDRFIEWMSYKATLILPVDRDLSTRVFDALLSGQIVIVPSIIADLDFAIPKEIQAKYGIIHVPNLEIDTLRKAFVQAIKMFNESGKEGARQRHEYALSNHMLVNRIEQMMNVIARVPLTPEFLQLKQSA